MDKVEIGNLIKERRQALRLKQSDLSEMAGVNLRTIIQVENSKVNPSLDTLEKIASVLGLVIRVEVKSEPQVRPQLVKDVMDDVTGKRQNKK